MLKCDKSFDCPFQETNADNYFAPTDVYILEVIEDITSKLGIHSNRLYMIRCSVEVSERFPPGIYFLREQTLSCTLQSGGGGGHANIAKFPSLLRRSYVAEIQGMSTKVVEFRSSKKVIANDRRMKNLVAYTQMRSPLCNRAHFPIFLACRPHTPPCGLFSPISQKRTSPSKSTVTTNI